MTNLFPGSRETIVLYLLQEHDDG